MLSNGNGGAGQSTHLVTLYLAITVPANVPPPGFPNNPPEIPTKGDDSPAEESTKPSIVPDSGGPTRTAAPEPLLPSSDPLPVETGTPMLDGAEIPPAEIALVALRRADEAKQPIDRKNTWKGAVRRIKWVMDTVSPIAEVRAIHSASPWLSRLSHSAPPVCKDCI